VKQSILAPSAILAAAMLTLAGCDSVRSTLGLDRHVPDETQVVARPPLTLPPDYSLRPPGGATPVSGEHEAGISMGQTQGAPGEAGAAAPQKEEKGFFGRLFSGEIFGGGEPDDPNQVWRPGQKQAPAADAPKAPPVEGTPSAPPPAPAQP